MDSPRKSGPGCLYIVYVELTSQPRAPIPCSVLCSYRIPYFCTDSVSMHTYDASEHKSGTRNIDFE